MRKQVDFAREDLTATLAHEVGRYRGGTGAPVLMAIDGRSGTGKSTLAARLARRIGAALIPGDDFYAGGTALRHEAPRDLAEGCIDRTRLRPVLDTLKTNRQARYAPFDWQAFDGSLSPREKVVDPRQVIVLEGVYANHPALRDLVDVSALLQLPTSERDRRLREREGAITEWERQWLRAEDWYFDTLARPETFDIVLDAT